eukprot:TRINITY_DN775_c0_g1_i2.p1 TRINITY_DN775_c0_g1~~TRINITY_DN775_c0_g1_i2.p1  ORF type:complete len:125 (-),score=31.23 TRINITY_DN775_c0_g1_i2:190-564(-)
MEEFEITTNEELAIYIVTLVERDFQPYWDRILPRFNRGSYTMAGDEGWDSPEDTMERETAREGINRLKNLETSRILKEDFTHQITDNIKENVDQKVSGVKRKTIRHAVRKHVRLAITSFIYEDL